MPELSADIHALADRLRLTTLLLTRRSRRERSDEAISDGQYQVLAALQRFGPLTPGALAEREQIQPPSMTRMVNCLTAAGLVERSPHASDGRQVLVTITDLGQREVDETRDKRTLFFANRIMALDEADQAILRRACEILNVMIEK